MKNPLEHPSMKNTLARLMALLLVAMIGAVVMAKRRV